MAVNNAININSLSGGFLYTDSLGGTLSSIGGAKVTRYLASTTWTKDAKTVGVTVIVWNGGWGGGSGRQGSTTAAGGGGGGCQGGFTSVTSNADAFNGTETVTIGAGGSGGLAQTSAATNGNTGGVGGTTVFGNVSYVQTVAVALGGTATVASGAASATILFANGLTGANTSQGINGATGRNTAGSAITTFPQSSSAASAMSMTMSASSAGGGGGADTASERAGGTGGNVYSPGISVSIAPLTLCAAGAGGTESGTINGGIGADGLYNTGGFITGGAGGGGGGGQKTGIVAGNGGNGGVPGGGGGGGGGSITLTNSGAGGAGGNGAIYVIEYF